MANGVGSAICYRNKSLLLERILPDKGWRKQGNLTISLPWKMAGYRVIPLLGYGESVRIPLFGV